MAGDVITCGTVADAMTGQAVRHSCVSLTVGDSVARLTLSRPEANNAINDEMVVGLATAMDELDRAAPRVVLLRAQGAHFTVGGDLEQLAAQVDRLPDLLDEIVPSYHQVLGRLAGLDVPVVCAAQGVVAGGGLGLMWCADLVIAATDLRLATGFAGLGLSGDGGSSWVLPRLLGQRRARQLLLHGRRIDAEEALAWGLVDELVERDRLESEAERRAAELASGPTVAYGHIKRLLRASDQNTFAEQLEAERTGMVATAATEDARAGILSFAKRRRPEFQGR
jgi:2-(1,2-epoxy-1,2-dihydrophenyl)acetyl-CoA isomerase